MKTTPYFERTLFHDRSPAANEHYERSSEQLFESDPTKTRIAVCFQTCNNAAESGDDKDTSTLHDHKSRIISLKRRHKRPLYNLSDGNSDDGADNCSILSEASSTALSIAMDQRQADSGPPLYPGLPKLIFSEIGSGEIENFVKRTKHDFRVFYLRQKHSLSRLHITKADFETLVRLCHIFPRFNEYVIGFGRKSSESEVGPPPLKFRPLHTAHDNAYRGFECTYILRYVENTNRGGRKDPWSLRQFGVYHRFKPGGSCCSTWILVGASQRTEGRLDLYTRSVDDVLAANPFELHVIFLDTAITSWRPYLVYKTQLVSELSAKANGVCIGSEDDDENFVSITVEDHQQLKQIEDDVADIILCLDSTSDTLTTFEEMYDRFCRSHSDSKSANSLDAVAVSLREKVKEILYFRRKAETLLSRIQSTRTLISSLLERQSGYNINHQIGALREGNTIMQTIAEKNRSDSTSMRVLTIITMVYLPCTIVSNFYSTQFVNQTEDDGGSTKMGYARNAWVFFAISIPLTVFTFLVWYTWVHMDHMRKLVGSQLTARKKAESPV